MPYTQSENSVELILRGCTPRATCRGELETPHLHCQYVPIAKIPDAHKASWGTLQHLCS